MNKDFVFVAKSNALKSGAVSMNAVDWQTMFGGLEKESLDEHEAFQVVAWVSRCVKLRANALAAVPAVVYGGKGEDAEVVEWEFADSLYDMLWMTEATLQLYGAGYWLRERNMVKDKGFRWLAPATIKPKYTADRGLDYFERRVPNKPPIRLEPVEELLYVWEPNLEAEVGPGKGWVSVVLTEGGVAQAQNQFAAGFFERGAIPAVLLSVEGNPPPEELNRLQQWWRRLLQGNRKAWETVAVRATVKPEVIGYPTDQLAMPELMDIVRSQIAVAAGVPQTMLEDAANYATAKEHHQAFYTETIVPEAIRVEAWLNRQLFEPQGLRIVLDWQSLDIFQEDEAERAGALREMVAAGVPVDLAMEMLGMDLPNNMTYDELRARLEVAAEQRAERARETAEANAAANTDNQGRPEIALPQPPTRAYPPQQREELRRWQRKALRAVKDGKGGGVSFITDQVAEDIQSAVRDRLAMAATEEEVKAAFEPPFRDDEAAAAYP